MWKVLFIKFPFSKKNESLVSEALNDNRVIVFPTETLYGLGGNALSKSVNDRIYKIKKRSIKRDILQILNKNLSKKKN